MASSLNLKLALGPAAAVVSALGALLLPEPTARAATFDATGALSLDPQLYGSLDFEAPPELFFPPDAKPQCQEAQHVLVTGEGALEGDTFARVDAKLSSGCVERFVVDLPVAATMARASVWVRHGTPLVTFVVRFPEESGVPAQAATFGPTGRTTSDGWVELSTNDFPVNLFEAEVAYLLVANDGALEGTDVDALEVRATGEWEPPRACSGVLDPTCQGDHRCIGGRCLVGGLHVPPLPHEAVRSEAVDVLQGRLRTFFGGRRTRLENLPVALATLDGVRGATSGFVFWDGVARAVRELRDWHTFSRGRIQSVPGRGKVLNVCFVEGDADRSHDVVPRDPKYADLLVSHVGPAGTVGLQRGDRLVAVDGKHPIEWMRGLLAVDWSHHVASDPTVFADHAEDLGGPSWSGGAKLVRFAETFSVIRCDADTGECADAIETIDVASLGSDPGAYQVACDNRPSYPLEPAKAPGPEHYVFSDFYQGKIAGTADDEQLFALVWDTLYGGGDPNGYVNAKLSGALGTWSQGARGVLLDHRAGNGGTIDAPALVSEYVRPKLTLAVARMTMPTAGFQGPDTADEGVLLFQGAPSQQRFIVGSAGYATDLPVALVLHRDGSASDYLPLALKGAPRTKLFAPHPTAGAFSTYLELGWWGGMGFQVASGDTITFDGVPWIGHGVAPDFLVEQTQSDLLAGKDSLLEAAVAWLRQESAP